MIALFFKKFFSFSCVVFLAVLLAACEDSAVKAIKEARVSGFTLTYGRILDSYTQVKNPTWTTRTQDDGTTLVKYKARYITPIPENLPVLRDLPSQNRSAFMAIQKKMAELRIYLVVEFILSANKKKFSVENVAIEYQDVYGKMISTDDAFKSIASNRPLAGLLYPPPFLDVLETHVKKANGIFVGGVFRPLEDEVFSGHIMVSQYRNSETRYLLNMHTSHRKTKDKCDFNGSCSKNGVTMRCVDSNYAQNSFTAKALDDVFEIINFTGAICAGTGKIIGKYEERQ